jgi:hypothetical protein
MFPEEWLDERTPAYLDGFYGAEADHEDGAKPHAMWINASIRLRRNGLSYTERQRLQGRVAYCRSAVGSAQDR